jgi:trigger factor
MQVNVSQESSHQKKLEFVVPAASVKDELDRAFRQMGGKVRLSGFRAGKIPRRVLEARFGEQIRADVANTLVQRSYTDALSEHAIEPVGRPNLDAPDPIARGNDFSFCITVDVRPDVTLEAYKGVEVVFPKVEITDDQLEATVKGRLEGQARLVEVSDRAIESGDMALVELVALDGDEEVVREQGTMIRTEADPYYPGVDQLLIGLEAGGKKTETVTFGEDARTEAVAGRELEVSVKVLSIQANEVPALDDDLAKELGYEGGADGMRQALRMQLEENATEMARNQARANLLEKLIGLNDFTVPDSLVEQSLDMLMNELKLQNAYRTGRDPRTISFSEEQINDLRGRAHFAAKAGLILESVTKTENIEVVDADLDARYQEIADSQGQTIEAVRAYFQQDKALDELRDRLLEEKTLDWLLEQAVLIDPPAPAEEVAPAEEATADEEAPAAEADEAAE